MSASKARVVVDFGDAEAPSYTIRRGDKKVVLLLSGVPRAKTEKQDTHWGQNERQRAASYQEISKAFLEIKGQVLPGNQIRRGSPVTWFFLELADRKNPKRHYRFVMEIDTKDISTRTTQHE